MPRIFPALRVSIDAERQKKGWYIITGSSSPDLLHNISESLAGRVAIVVLASLKSTERWQASPSPFYQAISEDINILHIESMRAVLIQEQLWNSWLLGGYS